MEKYERKTENFISEAVVISAALLLAPALRRRLELCRPVASRPCAGPVPQVAEGLVTRRRKEDFGQGCWHCSNWESLLGRIL